MAVLQTNKLEKHFDGVYAIDGLSIEVPKAAITSIIGPNGSGKTTLINVLSGMLDIDGGSIVLDGIRLSRFKSHEIPMYGLTRTFQEVRLFNQMTVLDNILVVLTERNVFSALFERHSNLHFMRTEELLKKINLWEKRNELAGNLSYGQRKLIEIARALAMEAQIYLLDEPFAGLFPEMLKVVVDIVKELKTRGKTVVLIEHNMDLIRELSDYVFVMDSGKLLADGKPNEVLNKREVIEAYLGE
ncbi:ABC transporter ATP-binding protein [Candidatus Jorgensenbacteria bacterium]|nr:ABC transporter ATP-binding protein [Candidatus Jorgensenbacteria bacterium]